MKCAVVQDLLPIYCDGVCSPETSSEIEKHTENCPVCSSLMKDYKSEVKPAGNKDSLPQKPFKKIKAKIFRSKLVIALLAIILLALISTVCYLGFGQIVKEQGHPSFETVISSFRTKKLMKKLCEGDIDYVMDRISIQDENLFYYDGSYVRMDIMENCREALNSYYNVIKDKNTDIELLSCDHGEFNYGSMSIMSYFVVRTEGLPDVAFQIDDVGGFYVINCFLYAGPFGPIPDKKSDFSYFISEICFSLNPGLPVDMSLFEKKAVNHVQDTNDNRYFSYVWQFVFDRYSDGDSYNEDYSAALTNRIEEMSNAGIHCDDFTKTHYRFDKESKRFLADINAVFTDPETQNKIVYIRTIQVKDYYKYTVLDEFEPTIIDGGVSQETRQMIENMF